TPYGLAKGWGRTLLLCLSTPIHVVFTLEQPVAYELTAQSRGILMEASQNCIDLLLRVCAAIRELIGEPAKYDDKLLAVGRDGLGAIAVYIVSDDLAVPGITRPFFGPERDAFG